MSSSLTGKIGALTSSLALGANKTDAEVGNIARLAVADKVAPAPAGLTQTQAGQYYLDALMAELKRYIVQEATRNGLKEIRGGRQVSDENQAASNANL